jgi:hypothetical protein
MNIVSDEGDPCHHGSNNYTSDEVTAAVMMAKNHQRGSKRTSIGRIKCRRRSHSIDGRCKSSSSAVINKSGRKYPTNHKDIPFFRSPPSTARYHGNYWIRIKPVAVRSNHSVVVEQSKTNPTIFKEQQQQQVPSLKDEEEQQQFLRCGIGIDVDNNIFPLPSSSSSSSSSTTVRRVSKSTSFDDELHDLHYLPSISPFACCQWRQSGSSSSGSGSSSSSTNNNYIPPKNSIVFFGESGKPVIIRPKSAYVVRR